jgi:hypothetical protein
VKRRALLSTFAATSASVGLAGCGLPGCRGVLLRLSLAHIAPEAALELGVRDVSEHHRELLRDATEEPATTDGSLASVIQASAETTARDLPVPDEGDAVVHAGDSHYRVRYAQDGERYTYLAERLDTEAAVLEAASVGLGAVAETDAGRGLVSRATEGTVEWCTRDDVNEDYGPVADAVAEASGVGDWTYYLHDETVTAPARWDGSYYRAELWADSAE